MLGKNNVSCNDLKKINVSHVKKDTCFRRLIVDGCVLQVEGFFFGGGGREKSYQNDI